MARPKNDGRGRIGGRAKGTPNKVPADMKEWIKDLLLRDRETFEERLNALPPEQYVQGYLRLINYIVPKQRPAGEEPPSTIEDFLAEVDGGR